MPQPRSVRRPRPDRRLSVTHPALAAQWHPDNELTPDEVSRGSDYRARWLCENGHEWSQRVTIRAVGGNGCRFCAGTALLEGFNDLASQHPELARQWHTDNELRPNQVLAGSHRKAKWVCALGHTWVTSVRLRTVRGYGCRTCGGKQVASGFNDLASKRPELLAQWHPELNGDLLPDQVSAHSNTDCWWRCAEGHAMLRTPAQMTGSRCAICSGKHIVSGVNDLASRYPSMAREWHPRNVGAPELVSWCSSRRVWWRCRHGHDWETSVNSRVSAQSAKSGQSGCPYCAGQRVLVGVNDLASQRPDLAAEWAPENKKTPEQVAIAASEKAIWICTAHGHRWETTPASRSVSGYGCSICAGRTVLAGFNDLASKHPNLVREWHPDNDLGPEQVTPYSHFRAAWRCAQSHTWRTAVHSRTRPGLGTGCPTCNAGMLVSRGEKQIVEMIRQAVGDRAQILTSTRTVPGTHEIDIVVPDRQLAIEFNGLYWHTERTGRGKDFHLGKTAACATAGLRLVHVWEDDWNFRRLGVERIIRSALGSFDGPDPTTCTVTRVGYRDVATLLAENQPSAGGSRATHHLALAHGGETVAAFALRLRGSRLDVTAFASAGVRGAAGALAPAVRELATDLGCTRVRWVTDTAVDDGTDAVTAGFTRAEELAPDFRYVHAGERRARSTFHRGRFRTDPSLEFSPDLSESALAALNGLDRIWDAGRVAWELDVA